MRKSIRAFLSVAFLLSLVPAHAGLKLSGRFRNDFYFVGGTNDSVSFNDIAETRLILKKSADDWKFYADVRLQMYYGQYAEQFAALEESSMEFMNWLIAGGYTNSLPAYLPESSDVFSRAEFLQISIPRVFVKFYTGFGDFSLGKTYVNFGNAGIFNPFEMSDELDFTDISADKSGILALEWDFPLGKLSGGNFYISPDDPLSNTGIGGSLYMNVWKFDIGAVLNRENYNNNIFGFYLKGDLGVGLSASYAYHFDDYFTNNSPGHNEAVIGIDYSFFDSKLIPSVEFHYDESGATSTNDYDPSDAWKARYYVYANLTYTHDEFLNFGVYSFINAVDGSGMLIPFVNYLVFDGLTATLLGSYVWGKDTQEFSSDVYGNYNVLLRLEAKL